MNLNELTTGRFNPQPVVQQPTQQQPREPNTPPYKPGEVTIGQPESIQVFLRYGREYAAQYGVELAINLEQALKTRAAGGFAITLREADMAARLQLPLDSKFFRAGLRKAALVEGITGEADNVYALRALYNRGVEFKYIKKLYDQCDEARKAKADQVMQETLDKLIATGLDPWPEELRNGFHTDLCKPEYMDWQQYEAASKRVIKRTTTSNSPSDDSDFTLRGPDNRRVTNFSEAAAAVGRTDHDSSAASRDS